MIPETYIKADLARVCWYEAGGYGGIDCMRAVGFTMYNRVQAGWFGGEWPQVLNRRHEAGAYDAAKEAFVNVRDIHFRMFLRGVEEIFEGTMVDLWTDGALYYCDLSREPREWFVKNILNRPDKHPRCASVGPLTFFQ